MAISYKGFTDGVYYFKFTEGNPHFWQWVIKSFPQIVQNHNLQTEKFEWENNTLKVYDPAFAMRLRLEWETQPEGGKWTT